MDSTFFNVHKDEVKPRLKACVFSEYTRAVQLDGIISSSRLFI